MKLYETNYTAAAGLMPLKINGRRYNTHTSKCVAFSKDGAKELFKKTNGEYWLHIMVGGVGHYIAPISKKEGELQMNLIEQTW